MIATIIIRNQMRTAVKSAPGTQPWASRPSPRWPVGRSLGSRSFAIILVASSLSSSGCSSSRCSSRIRNQ